MQAVDLVSNSYNYDLVYDVTIWCLLGCLYDLVISNYDLILGAIDYLTTVSITSDAYTSGELVYEWQEGSSVNFLPGMVLSQFDLMGSPYRNLTFVRREGEFSVLQVSFNLQRHTGYFLIQANITNPFNLSKSSIINNYQISSSIPGLRSLCSNRRSKLGFILDS